MWLVYFIILVVIALITGYFMEEGDTKAIRVSSEFSFAVSIVLLICLVIIPLIVNDNNKDICKIEKVELTDFMEIKQDINGKYFYIRQDYEKNYPEVKIIKSGKTELKTIYYKQKDKFLDSILFDYSEEVLYLNLEDLQ